MNPEIGNNYDLIRTGVRVIIYIQTTIRSTEMGDYNAAIYEKISTIKWSKRKSDIRASFI